MLPQINWSLVGFIAERVSDGWFIRLHDGLDSILCTMFPYVNSERDIIVDSDFQRVLPAPDVLSPAQRDVAVQIKVCPRVRGPGHMHWLAVGRVTQTLFGLTKSSRILGVCCIIPIYIISERHVGANTRAPLRKEKGTVSEKVGQG